jgi:hypothetical protein
MQFYYAGAGEERAGMDDGAGDAAPEEEQELKVKAKETKVKDSGSQDALGIIRSQSLKKLQSERGIDAGSSVAGIMQRSASPMQNDDSSASGTEGTPSTVNTRERLEAWKAAQVEKKKQRVAESGADDEKKDDGTMQQLRAFVMSFALMRAQGSLGAAVDEMASLKSNKTKETERFFSELLDCMLTLAQDGFFHSPNGLPGAREVWGLCSPLIALLDGRFKVTQTLAGEEAPQSKSEPKSTHGSPRSHGSPRNPAFESVNPIFGSRDVATAALDTSDGFEDASPSGGRRGRSNSEPWSQTVQMDPTISAERTSKGLEDKKDSALIRLARRLPGTSMGVKSIAAVEFLQRGGGAEDGMAEVLADEWSRQEEDSVLPRYRVSAMNNTEVRSKETILRILRVVSHMSLDLRLSQLLHLQTGGAKSGDKHGVIKLMKRQLFNVGRYKTLLVNDDGTGVLDGPQVLAVILLLVFMGITITLLQDKTNSLEGYEKGVELFELAALAAFTVEMSLRMFAMGLCAYLKENMCRMDMLVVLVDFALIVAEESLDAFDRPAGAVANATLAGTQEVQGHSALDNVSVLRGLRLLRFLRILRLRRVYKALEKARRKQAKDETLSEEEIKQFEELFRKEEREAKQNENNFAAALDLNLMSKREPLASVCLDLLMYQSESLFAIALFSLERHFCQRKALVQAVSAVQLVPNEQEESLRLMQEDLKALRQNISSFAIWARSGGDLLRGESVLNTLSKLTELCSEQPNTSQLGLCITWSKDLPVASHSSRDCAFTRPPNPANQALLEKLNVHSVVLEAVQLRPATGAASASAGGSSRVDADVAKIVAQIQAACCQFLCEFARDNSHGRQGVSENFPMYVLLAKQADSHTEKFKAANTEQLHENQDKMKCFIALTKSIDQLLLSLVQQNRKLCEEFSDDVLRTLTDLLQRRVQLKNYDEAARLVLLFTHVFMHNDQPVKELQERVLLATTSRATVKAICFKPFLKVGINTQPQPQLIQPNPKRKTCPGLLGGEAGGDEGGEQPARWAELSPHLSGGRAQLFFGPLYWAQPRVRKGAAPATALQHSSAGDWQH